MSEGKSELQDQGSHLAQHPPFLWDVAVSKRIEAGDQARIWERFKVSSLFNTSKGKRAYS